MLLMLAERPVAPGKDPSPQGMPDSKPAHLGLVLFAQSS